jgi:hypothetical protein
MVEVRHVSLLSDMYIFRKCYLSQPSEMTENYESADLIDAGAHEKELRRISGY